MNKDKCIDALYDAVEMQAEISCSKCKARDTEHNVDDLSAALVFYNSGWRATSMNVYCPTCAVKHLKNP